MLHHVEIPLAERDTVYHYRVRTGSQQSQDATFQAYPTDMLRVAVAADWLRKPSLAALEAEQPHLLLTAGDHVTSLWESCTPGDKECMAAFTTLIDTYPELFRSTPLMPVLGNHDREIRPRGSKPPAEAVYDVDATAFRRTFPLPGDGWKWYFDVPDFAVRFVALDLNHTSDQGTTWQSCHDFDEQSEQFRWYKELMAQRPPGFVVTLYNERNATSRNHARGAWHQLFRQGTACITGFGYFAERAEVDGFPYYNTSLSGTGDVYADPHSKFLAREDNYMLLTFERQQATMTIEIKSLAGPTLDRKTFRVREE